jgi:hypothetical protein
MDSRQAHFYLDSLTIGSIAAIRQVVLSTESAAEINLKLYPNPASKTLQWQLTNIDTKDKFYINNLLGHTILAGKLSDRNATIENLVSGVYIFIIQKKDKRYRYKFIKE